MAPSPRGAPSARSVAGAQPILSRHPLDGNDNDLELEESVEQIRDHDDEDGPDVPRDDPEFGGANMRDGGTNEPKTIEMPAYKKFLFSKWGCAVLISILTIIILLFIRPAFFLRRRENTLDKPRINWLVVFITWIVLFLSIALIPMLITFCRKKWVGKVDRPGPRDS